MKSFRLFAFVFVTALGAAVAFTAFSSTVHAEGLWQTDFKAAQAKAKAENKYLLVDFTGSDWCSWCMKLHNEVFDKEPFKAEAPKQFVLVELDFPQQKEQSDVLKKQNKELSEKYKIQGFPTVLLMDAEGNPFAWTGYRDGGAEKYVTFLGELPKIYQGILALKAKLEKTQGLDRAKVLDQIVEDSQKLGNESDQVEDWCKEIIALDPGNKTGLKVKYEFPMGLKEAIKLLKGGQLAKAAEALDKIMSLTGVPVEMRVEGFMVQTQICIMQKKFAAAVAALKLAKQAAPGGPNVKEIDDSIQKLSGAAEAQAAAEKLEAGLDKASGLDRAKLLDQLISAKEQLAPFDPDAHENVAKWTKEIVALDVDNKAGLKKKHQFRMALADAAELMQAGKADEANAALDKALETAGTSGDDVQAGRFLKAQIALMQHNNAEGVTHLKSALEAAPTGRYAPVIKMLLARYEQKKPAAATSKSAVE